MVAVGIGPASPPVLAHHQRLVALDGNGQDLVGAGDVHLAQVSGVGRIGVVDHQDPAHAVLGAAAGGGGTGDVGDLTVDEGGPELVGVPASSGPVLLKRTSCSGWARPGC